MVYLFTLTIISTNWNFELQFTVLSEYLWVVNRTMNNYTVDQGISECAS